MKSSTRNILIVLSIAFVGLIVFATLGKKNGWMGGAKASDVTVAKAERHNIIETVSATGKIYPEIEVKISPDVSGEIIDLPHQDGDSVTKGDLLVRIKPDVYISMLNRADASVKQAKASLANAQARLAQVRGQMENAKLTYDRNVKLHEKKVISEADYQNAVVAYKNAEGELEAADQNVKASDFNVKSFEAALKEANDNLVKTTIYAPMSGTITMLNVEKGERVVGTTQMLGTEMMHISNLSNMEVRVDVSENDILRIDLADTVEIEVDAYLDRKFKGLVTHIANSAKAGAASLSTETVTNFTVKIGILKSSYQDLLDSTGEFPFKPGMSASVNIITKRVPNALSVPIQAVTLNSDTSKGKEIVFLYDKGVARKVPVTTGIQDDKYIQIKTGITEGQTVITGPYSLISRNLEDGDPVKIMEDDIKGKKKEAVKK